MIQLETKIQSFKSAKDYGEGLREWDGFVMGSDGAR